MFLKRFILAALAALSLTTAATAAEPYDHRQPGPSTEGYLYDYQHASFLVAQLYRGALFREPDQQGAWGWTQQILSRGYQGLLDDAYGIGTSQEFATDVYQRGAQAVVYNLYSIWLFREPDAQGYWGWVNGFNNARRPQDLGRLLRDFVATQEFYQKNIAPWGY